MSSFLAKNSYYLNFCEKSLLRWRTRWAGRRGAGGGVSHLQRKRAVAFLQQLSLV